MTPRVIMASCTLYSFMFAAVFVCHGVTSGEPPKKEESVTTKELLNIISRLQTQIDGLEHNLDEQLKMNENLQNQVIGISDRISTLAVVGGGAVFTRWGRSICGIGGDTTRIYTGFMAKGVYNDTGSGTNYQCLPQNPEFEKRVNGTQSTRNLMFGTEYKGDPDLIFDFTNFQGSSFVNQNVPCAVCYVANRTAVVMIPAQKSCPNGWVEEYWGYLVSSLYTATGQSSYECVDHAPEAVDGGANDESSSDIYNVEARCGILPCPPYDDSFELTCAVCSK